jgi:hypothetical protein
LAGQPGRQHRASLELAARGAFGPGRLAQARLGRSEIASRRFADRLGCGTLRTRLDKRVAARFRRRSRCRQGLLDLLQAVDPDHPLGGDSAFAAGDEAIPAAQPPIERDQPLSDRQCDLAVVRLDNSDLRQTAGERRRRLDMLRERLDAGRQRRISLVRR